MSILVEPIDHDGEGFLLDGAKLSTNVDGSKTVEGHDEIGQKWRIRIPRWVFTNEDFTKVE